MKPAPYLTLVALALCLSAAAAPAADDPPRELRELLATVDGQATLRIRVAAGEPVIGQAHHVENDTLVVRSDAGTPARVALADIVEVSLRRETVREGAHWGATIGATALGTLGALFGLALSAWEGDPEAAPAVAGGLIGIAVGGAIGSGVGAGIGAMDRSWDVVYPTTAPRVERRTRLALEGGSAFGRGLIEGGDGVSARLSVLKRTSRRLEIGPVAEFYDVGGYKYTDSPWGVYAESASISLGVGFAVRANSAARGLRPFADTELAWRAQDGLHLGSHVGGGLRWRGQGAAELTVGVRHHFLVTHSEETSPAFWSVTAGVVLGR